MSDDDRYYLAFEDRVPDEPVPYNATREFVWQVLAAMSLGLGAWYIGWRWTSSLNWAVPWFALPLVCAESLAFLGSVLNTFNLWSCRDTAPSPPPARACEAGIDDPDTDRRITVDVFFPTYSEDPELVRLSLQDGKRITYPHALDLKIWVLDDGRRPAMAEVARQEGVGYLTRPNNVGFKAGNLHSGLQQTHGDFVVICDADTRPLPDLLTETLGYFRDPQVAWVQTPQWYYDLPAGQPLPDWLGRLPGPLGVVGRLCGRAIERVFGPINCGADPLGNDPRMFFDCILRRRNGSNASFCCGATSVHRRETVMAGALREFAEEVERFTKQQVRDVRQPELAAPLAEIIRQEAAREIAVMPYKYHVSEDIFTSLVLHADRERGWKSVYHPRPLSKMLSPQDLLAFTVQRFKYAGGTLDIAKSHNPLWLPGLSLAQRVLYFTTVYSYFAWTWIVVFLAAPIVYFVSGLTPVEAYGPSFYAHMLPYLLVNRVAFMIGTWGLPTGRGEAYYVAGFHLQIRAIYTILRGRKIGFPVTPKVRDSQTHGALVRIHVAVIALTVAAAIFHGVMMALGRFDDQGAFLLNLFWAAYNVRALAVIVGAAYMNQASERSAPTGGELVGAARA